MKYDHSGKCFELNEREAIIFGAPWEANRPYPQRLADKLLERSIESIGKIATGNRGLGEAVLQDL
jgi:hypothetical protein